MSAPLYLSIALLCFAHITLSSTASRDQCVFVFDFDGTIKLYEGERLSKEAKEVIEYLASKGAPIGINTASCAVDYVKRYLHERVNRSIFSYDFLGSTRARYCTSTKPPGMYQIMAYYGGTKACTILYDDSWSNRQAVLDAGFQYQHVNVKVGVTWTDFWSGVGILRGKGCSCRL